LNFLLFLLVVVQVPNASMLRMASSTESRRANAGSGSGGVDSWKPAPLVSGADSLRSAAASPSAVGRNSVSRRLVLDSFFPPAAAAGDGVLKFGKKINFS
jgi:hypothetical protein